MAKARAWVFTINNYTEADVDSVKALAELAVYVICGKETGEKGTPHLQGYVYFKNARTRAGISRLLRRAWLDIAKGGAEDSKKYCSKENVFFEAGEPPQQGKRTDIDIVRKMVNDGMLMPEITQKASSLQAIKTAETLMKYQTAKTRKVTVKWFWGATGTGKTHTAIAEAGEDAWISNRSLRWWDGYWGQDAVVIDDFRGDYCPFHELLRYLDKWPVRVEIKGGHMAVRATKIWITSAFPPNEVYNKTGEDLKQLLRRISEIRRFPLETGTEVAGNNVPRPPTPSLGPPDPIEPAAALSSAGYGIGCRNPRDSGAAPRPVRSGECACDSAFPEG